MWPSYVREAYEEQQRNPQKHPVQLELPMDSKWTQLHYNALAKEIREIFPVRQPINSSLEGQKTDIAQMIERAILSVFAINLCKRFKEDNPDFDPIKWLDQCSPDTDLYPLSELWEDA